MSGVHPLSETTLPGHSTLTKQTLRIPYHDVKIGKKTVITEYVRGRRHRKPVSVS